MTAVKNEIENIDHLYLAFDGLSSPDAYKQAQHMYQSGQVTDDVFVRLTNYIDNMDWSPVQTFSEPLAPYKPSALIDRILEDSYQDEITPLQAAKKIDDYYKKLLKKQMVNMLKSMPT